MATTLDKVKRLSAEQRSFALAITVVGDRIGRLAEADAEDLFQLFKYFVQAQTDEDRDAAEAAIWELLSQEPVTAESLDLAEGENQDEEFNKWKGFVSEKVRDARERAGLTQDQLAAQTGLPQSHISRIERKKLSPSHTTLQKIADALKIPVSDLDPSL